ncbi:MAG: iron-containing alcohol dehydrogenase [Sulfuricurvum sp.]|uniref:iron-containing alcohol dehydrogenase n=1 Tax=Sulfuricurvum sp. TaxID=2025608 RepID=UPI002601768C|nr:iron-containing alcohol dehydrogenase [Sulfuricurvum sp.]MDD2830391.1 iron-containing alcohol dehydrogenase [Sulfuricurvum sp.]
MENFIFNIPTKAFFGKGQLDNLAAGIKEFGGSRVLLAYGGGSIKSNGIYQAVLEQFSKAGIFHVELSGIKPNPPIEDVYEGIRIYKENNLNFIVAVGGGSALDAAKAIAAGAKYDGDVFDLISGKVAVTNAAPLATVLTMAGTGSEMDMGGVITVGEEHKKYAILHPLLNPKFSILDPEYTYTVPTHHTMAGCSDILSHLMEQYLRPDEDAEVSDRMNEGVMKVVFDNAPKLLQNPQDYNARANIMWASSMALAGFQFMSGKKFGAFPVHAMGHELSSLNDMTHGITLALITPAWIRYTLKVAPQYTPMFARFARNVFGVTETDDTKAALMGIEQLEGFYQAIGMPSRMGDAGVEESQLEYLAEKATEFGDIGTMSPINKAEALEIYTMAW